MKTFNKLISLAIISMTSLVYTACSDSFFNRYPTDSMQMETYLKNDTELQNILFNGYYHLQDITLNVNYVNSLATDEGYDYKKNNSVDHINLNESTWDATLGITSEIWEHCFNMINRCNNVLLKLDNATAANRTQYEGEASFLRAYAYFTLVRLFGPVPITKMPIEDYSTLYSYGRSSMDEVYNLIKEDLETAISSLPDNYSADNMKGRATRIAAYTMQADVYMTLQDFTSAQKSIENILTYANQNSERLGLESDVLRIYSSNNPMGKEIIFAAQYNNGATMVANPLMGRSIPAATPSTQPAYIYPDGTKSTITTSQGTSCMLMTWELYNEFKANNNDQRFQKLVYNGIYTNEYVSVASEEVDVTQEGYTYLPVTLKYFDFGNEGMTTCACGNDNIIYRFADVLLMYAECLNETGTPESASNYLNQVRTRAGLANTTATTREEMDIAIENERMLELCFEGHRWYDLVRKGRITEVMEKHFAHRTQGLNPTFQSGNNGMTVSNASDVTGTPGTWKWTGSSAAILFGIPYDQIQLSGDWKQNELY